AACLEIRIALREAPSEADDSAPLSERPQGPRRWCVVRAPLASSLHSTPANVHDQTRRNTTGLAVVDLICTGGGRSSSRAAPRVSSRASACTQVWIRPAHRASEARPCPCYRGLSYHSPTLRRSNSHRVRRR